MNVCRERWQLHCPVHEERNRNLLLLYEGTGDPALLRTAEGEKRKSPVRNTGRTEKELKTNRKRTESVPGRKTPLQIFEQSVHGQRTQRPPQR